MPNTNPQAVAFANNYARKMADTDVSFYLTCKQFLLVWDGQTIGTVIPNDATVISDGAATDGRSIITNAQVNILVSNMRSFVTTHEASANLILNQSMQIQVNGKSQV